MCTQPTFMKSNSVYVGIKSFGVNPIPCGQCLECQNAIKQDWETRFSFWLDSLYKRNGVAVMLTFTYNDSHLPHFPNDVIFSSLVDNDGNRLPCFDLADVKSFLSVLRNRVNRCFKSSEQLYKYFLVEEYGSDTRRPHLHVIFGCEQSVDIDVFVELCRDAWCDKENKRERGFMFPKPANVFKKEINGRLYNASNQYIGKNGMLDGRVKIASVTRVSACTYACKYVLKDVSYYGIDCINDFLHSPLLSKKQKRERKMIMRNFLPCHLSSQGIGYECLDRFKSDEDSLRALDRGIMNPLTLKSVPLPQFLVNKLLYVNVRSERTSIRRGNKVVAVYERHLSAFGREYMGKVFDIRYKKTLDKVSNFFGDLANRRAAFASVSYKEDGRFVYAPSDFKYIQENIVPSDYRRIALYSLVVSRLNGTFLSEFLSSHSLDDLFDYNLLRSIYVDAKDSVFYSNCYKIVDYGRIRVPLRNTSLELKDFDYSVFGDVYFYYNAYVKVSAYSRNRVAEYYREVFILRQKYRRTKAKYDINLC